MMSLIGAGVLVALLASSLLDWTGDQCHDFSHRPGADSTHRLFGTKTGYATAYGALHSPESQHQPESQGYQQHQGYHQQHHQKRQQQQQHLKQQIQVDVPGFYGHETLVQLDARLRAPERQCRLVQLHYFGRHGARFPSADETLRLADALRQVQARIEPARFEAPSAAPSAGLAQQVPTGASNCSNPLLAYKKWASFLVAPGEQANMLLDSGYQDTQDVARRLKRVYPDAFDARRAQIALGTTQELRTAQTAMCFVRHFENFVILPESNACLLDALPPLAAPKDQQEAAAIAASRCYAKFIEKYKNDKLSFHKQCRGFVTDTSYLNDFDLDAPNRTQFIAERISHLLKLKAPSSENPQTTSKGTDERLSPLETRALYKLCKYETAHLAGGDSIWCNLFQNSELKFYEYLDDIDDFYNQAFGQESQAKSACPATTALIGHFKRAVAHEPAPNKLPQQQVESFFYFSHAEVIQRLFAATVSLKSDPAYAKRTVLAHLASRSAPERRQWRSSLVSPFSANLAFALYECPASKQFQVVASSNERPIVIDGCDGPVCELSKLLENSDLNMQPKKCQLSEICQRMIVIK